MKDFTVFVEQRTAAFWWLAFLLFLVVCFGVFVNTFGHSWAYDDQVVILENQDVKTLSGFIENHRPGRPVRELSLLLDHKVFGLNPAGWHVQHLFWHGLNGFLVFALILRLGGSPMAALFAGMVFLIHPLQVEVVANLSHRKASLALAFILLSFHALKCAYVKNAKILWLGLAFVSAILGALAYQMVYVLPVLWIAYELLFVDKKKRFFARFPIVLPIILLIILVGGVLWYLHGGNRQFMLGLLQQMFSNFNHFDPVSESMWLMMMLKSWAFMFAKFFWPSGLAIDYIYSVPKSWMNIWVLWALAFLALGIITIFKCRKSTPLVAYAITWTLVFWLPVSNLYPTAAYFAADRYMYIPSVGLALLVGVGLSWLVKINRRIASGAAVVVVVALVWVTIPQIDVWKNNYNLYEHSYRVNPTSSLALNNYGAKLVKEGKWREGLAMIEEAAKNPYHFEANMNAAMFYNNMGLKDKAAYYFKRSRNPHAIK